MTKKLDFACGQSKLPGYIGLDVYPGSDVDVVHNFNCYPYPFEDNTFDEIRCWSSLEHPDDFMKCVVELHRIAKPNALIKVLVPHYSGPDAYRDPTHKTFFSYITFDFFAEGTSYRSPYNGLLKIENRMFGVPENTGVIKTIFKMIFNAIPNFYERYLCWIFPTKTMYYELRVLKN